MYFKSYDSFIKAIKEHLCYYNPGPAGEYNKKYYKHILHIPSGSSKKDAIENLLKRDMVEVDLFENPQQYAHHLNSSQVVCYEFFRPLLRQEGTATDLLKQFLSDNHIENKTDVMLGRFEYIPDSTEYTNFDFYLEGPTMKVFFEIKYTENGFGCCEKDKSHREKFDSLYKQMIEECGCLSQSPSFEDFCKYYQLFRNVLRVTKENGEHEYSVFLYPRENRKAEKHFFEFKKKYISGTYADHVISIHWEDCTKYMSIIFRKKFFFYTE